MGGYKQGKITLRNTGTFHNDVQAGFHYKLETAVVAVDLERACNREHLTVIIAGFGRVRVNSWLVSWIGTALMDTIVALCLADWISEPTRICPSLPGAN